MKKIFTLFALASAMFFSANADTPLRIGGGWNEGFVGQANAFTFNINKQWGAAEFEIAFKSEDISTIKIEFEEPCPAGFQINYNWLANETDTESTPQYNVADPTGKTSVEVTINKEAGHNYITQIACQYTGSDPVVLKIKNLQIATSNGVSTSYPKFTSWAGSDETVYYTGEVYLPKQWMQLQVSELTGMSDVTVCVELNEYYDGVQLCIDYTDGSSEWPQFEANGSKTVTTKAGAEIKNFGIQHTEDGDLRVIVKGATLITESAGLDTITTNTSDQKKLVNGKIVIVKDGVSYNAFGQKM